MENLLNFCLKALGLTLLFTACGSPNQKCYKAQLSPVEKSTFANQMSHRFYQGSPQEQMLYRDALKLDDKSAALNRERGIAFLKRGIFSEYNNGYPQAEKYDPLHWQGWCGYLHLYFHRDYENAIEDFIALDSLTPNITDYPQSTSDKLMRGIAYMQLKQYENALANFDIFLKEETAAVEEKYLGSPIWAFRSCVLDSLGHHQKAIEALEHGIKVCQGENSELWFYRGKHHFLNKEFKQAKDCLNKALQQNQEGYTFHRPYVEEFLEIQEPEIQDLLAQIP